MRNSPIITHFGTSRVPSPSPFPSLQRPEWTPDVQRVHTCADARAYSVVCCVRFSAEVKYLPTGCIRTAQIYDTNVCVPTPRHEWPPHALQQATPQPASELPLPTPPYRPCTHP